MGRGVSPVARGACGGEGEAQVGGIIATTDIKFNPSMLPAVSQESDSTDIAILRPIVHTKREELLPLGVSMLWIFCALTAYYILKPIRSAVLQTLIGVDNKWIALLATTVFVGFFAYGYGKIVPKVKRRTLVVSTFVAFIGCLIFFAVAFPHGKEMEGGSPLVGHIFYVWVSTFSVLVVSQFWSVATEAWTKEEGKRLFGAIGIGAVAGGIFGTAGVSKFAEKLYIWQMFMISAALLGVCLVLSLYILAFAEKRHAHVAKDGDADKKKEDVDTSNAVSLVMKSPYLRLIAIMMLVLNIVNTNSEWILDKMVHSAHLSSADTTSFYGEFYLFQNIVTFCIQFFLTARVQRIFGARGALFVTPAIGILGGLAFIVAPLLNVIKWEKVAENGADYSIQSNTRELLYVPTSDLEKYSAKNLNDTFVVRVGDAVAAGLIFIASAFVIPAMGEVGLRVLMGFNVVLGVAWMVLVARIGAMHKEKMGDADGNGNGNGNKTKQMGEAKATA